MIDLLRSRRSIRKYTDGAVDAESRALLEEALLRAPSSRNKRPWEYIFVDDRALLETLARTKPHGSSFLEKAALAIVVCGDGAQCDVWIEDCAIASFIAHLQAHALGLGSCWVQIRQRKHDDGTSADSFVRELLDVPDRLQIEAIIAIGHPAEQKEGIADEKLERSKIYSNRYGQRG